ncbi:MAG: ORF6N domain-containing protein [Saprospiraceae bacterium]|nr:ORF6N domain-containing protein [Saprospiraceae bacterium]MCF8251265.1 ORF6N domain-containing protein [Saprospiraceae bacterium]MCF8280844.1 ORF6N domain-containing protein [Bacteroidales bacterium]MCF8311802.1 ORF6N domain-containing protein [Saprospiraceae bacterium]MCF8441943.1 ORF6N domain-containing protein [Saprospiraceae bacterium]
MKKLTPSSEEFLSQIYQIRGQRVMLDMVLAEVYGVTTKRLNQQVQRNIKRFPPEFMFQLTDEEFEDLRLQIATTNFTMRRVPPYAFTEHGAIMAASVLNTDAAVQASIYVVKAFVQMRNVIGIYKELEQRLTDLEVQFGEQGAQIQQILQVIRQFVQKENEPRKPIGFK